MLVEIIEDVWAHLEDIECVILEDEEVSIKLRNNPHGATANFETKKEAIEFCELTVKMVNTYLEEKGEK